MKSLDNKNELSSLSVVMPVYNEEGAISKVVGDFCNKILRKFKNKEFILVNDRSTDGTGEILKKLKCKYSYLKILTNAHNQGHGPSLLRAYKEAKNDYIFHCDSDNQFLAEDFWLLWKELKKRNLDLVMGYRKKRNDPAYRIVMSKMLVLFNLVLFGVYNHDVNAPFKLYKKSSLGKVLATVPRNAFVPTVLMVLAADSLNMRIGEVAVRHLPRLTGKSFIRNWKIMTFCWKAGGEIIKFRKRLRKSS